jgi:soluble lytic murein transglycosylase-like protein
MACEGLVSVALVSVALVCVLAVHTPAQANEVWGYVDEQGEAHFSDKKLDERYQLYARKDVALLPQIGASGVAQHAASAPAGGKPAADRVADKAADKVADDKTLSDKTTQSKAQAAPLSTTKASTATISAFASGKTAAPALWATSSAVGTLPPSLAAVSASWIASGGQWPPSSAASVKGKPAAVVVPPAIKAFFDTSEGYKAAKPILRDAAKRYGVDYELLKAMITVESRFDNVAVSPKAAVGLMQIISPTAQRYGVRPDPKRGVYFKLLDPVVNINTGTQYIRDLIKLFPKRLDLAVASYNAGEGAVQRSGNQVPPYPETQNYVVSVLQLYLHLKPSAALSVLALPAGAAPSAPLAAGTVPANSAAVLAAGGSSGSGTATLSPLLPRGAALPGTPARVRVQLGSSAQSAVASVPSATAVAALGAAAPALGATAPAHNTSAARNALPTVKPSPVAIVPEPEPGAALPATSSVK